MNDVILLTIPAKPEYVLTVRLAVAGIATRAGLDVESIEDLKVCVAEGCILLIGEEESEGNENIDISFKIDKELEINLSRNKRCTLLSGEAGELSVNIMESMVDRVFISCKDDACAISLLKELN